MKAEKAAEFSFLMSIPAIAGGFVLTMKDKVDSIKLNLLTHGKVS